MNNQQVIDSIRAWVISARENAKRTAELADLLDHLVQEEEGKGTSTTEPPPPPPPPAHESFQAGEEAPWERECFFPWHYDEESTKTVFEKFTYENRLEFSNIMREIYIRGGRKTPRIGQFIMSGSMQRHAPTLFYVCAFSLWFGGNRDRVVKYLERNTDQIGIDEQIIEEFSGLLMEASLEFNKLQWKGDAAPAANSASMNQQWFTPNDPPPPPKPIPSVEEIEARLYADQEKVGQYDRRSLRGIHHLAPDIRFHLEKGLNAQAVLAVIQASKTWSRFKGDRTALQNTILSL